jgi:diguanylate cyclase (GGDEF)-like protein/hemerythrin-like metal-binding protein
VFEDLSIAVRDAVERLANSLPLLLVVAVVQLVGLSLLVVLLIRHFRTAEQLRRLTDAASAISRGDRQARAALSNSGPLGEFGQTFDNMAGLVANEIRSLRATQRELEQLVATDRLTGVGNRRQFEQQTDAESGRAKRYGIPASLILFDVDHFKRINDRYGHQVGDAVLVNLTRRVAHSLRDTDCIARWGGEEFAVLTPCTPVSGAEVLAEKIRRVVAEDDFDVVGRVTISVGVTQLRPGETAAHWIARADQLLYEAKRAGRNRVHSSENDADPPIPFVLVWGDQFLVHHAEIDAEHAEIFRLANELILGEKDGPKSAIMARFDALLDQVAAHFRSEETILAGYDCPSADLAEHTLLHQGLLAQATDLRRRLEEGAIGLSEVGDFVVRRIAVGHLLTEDLPLFASLADSATIAVKDNRPPSLRVRLQRAILG